MKSLVQSNKSLKRRKRKIRVSTIQLTIMCIPALTLVGMFSYFPMFGLLIAFKKYTFTKGIFASDWVGFKNFEFFFTSQDVWDVTRNTILYNLGMIIVGTIIPVILALMIYEISNKKLIKIYQTTMFFPFFLSWVVVGFVAYTFLNEPFGILNRFLESAGMNAVQWYSEPQLWPYILIFFGSWKFVGLSTVIYYSSLMSINDEYFEAAEIDGANKLQRIWHISLPCISSVIILLVLLALGRIFYSDFGLFWYLPRKYAKLGGLYSTTDVIDTYVYRSLRVVGDIGMSSAVNFYQSVMGTITILFFNFIVRKVKYESSLF